MMPYDRQAFFLPRIDKDCFEEGFLMQGVHLAKVSCLVQAGVDRQEQWQREGDVRDQAKQWLSAGKDWLSGASKKVAQAVKETQAQINNKLEELDTRHSQGGLACVNPKDKRSRCSKSCPGEAIACPAVQSRVLDF